MTTLETARRQATFELRSRWNLNTKWGLAEPLQRAETETTTDLVSEHLSSYLGRGALGGCLRHRRRDKATTMDLVSEHLNPSLGKDALGGCLRHRRRDRAQQPWDVSSSVWSPRKGSCLYRAGTPVRESGGEDSHLKRKNRESSLISLPPPPGTCGAVRRRPASLRDHGGPVLQRGARRAGHRRARGSPSGSGVSLSLPFGVMAALGGLPLGGPSRDQQQSPRTPLSFSSPPPRPLGTGGLTRPSWPPRLFASRWVPSPRAPSLASVPYGIVLVRVRALLVRWSSLWWGRI